MIRLPIIHAGRNAVLQDRQEGMAIIGALVVVAAVSVMTASIMDRQALLADTMVGERDRIQAKWLLRGGLDWARVILFNDAQRNPVTRKDAVWAQPIVGFEVSSPGAPRKAYLSGQIEDEQGKYNISALALKGMIQSKEVVVLEALLSDLDMPVSLAPAIARKVAETQTANDRHQAAPGLRAISDLVAVDGVTLDMAARLSAYLTVLPQKTTINANTASAEVLSASVAGLGLAQARALVEQRDDGLWFNNPADFFNRLADPGIVPGNQISVRSEWFKVTGRVTMDSTTASMQTLLHREGGEPPVISWIKD